MAEGGADTRRRTGGRGAALARRLIAPFRRFFNRRRTLILGTTIVVLCAAYHTDAVYLFFRDHLNHRVRKATDLDPLRSADRVAHSLDMVGWLKAMGKPLREGDLIDLRITDGDLKKLEKYAKRKPPRKRWLDAAIELDGAYHGARIKLHGTDILHFSGGKYSYTVKVDSTAAASLHFKRFKLIKAEDVDPTVIAVNRMAASMGLIAPAGRLVMLRINGKDHGHYYFVEDLRKEYLEREFGITNFALLQNVSDWTRKENVSTGGHHVSALDLYHGHLEAGEGPAYEKAVAVYRVLAERISEGDIAAVRERFDEDYMGRFLALLSLFNESHFISGDNLRLVYDLSRGKFYPVYRAETWGKGLNTQVFAQEDIFINTFPNYNKLLFRSRPLYITAPNAAIFKMLLADDGVRASRDTHLHRILTGRARFMEDLRTGRDASEPVFLRSSASRRESGIMRLEQDRIVKTMMDMARKYIDYGHIYGSYDSLAGKLHLAPDAFAGVHLVDTLTGGVERDLRGIGFDADLNITHRRIAIDARDGRFHPRNLLFVNAITGDTIRKGHVHINRIDAAPSVEQLNTLDMLAANGVGYDLRGDSLVLRPGTHVLRSTVIVSPDYSTHFPAGTVVELANGVSLVMNGNVTIGGTIARKVVFRNLDPAGAFGTVAIIGQDASSTTTIDHLSVSGGSETHVAGKLFTGQFAVYNSNATIRNSSFRNARGDDGINVKFSTVVLDSCVFADNLADQVDLDFCSGIVSNCVFSTSVPHHNGDGLDFSGSRVLVTGCAFSGFADKAVSVGERTEALLHGNRFTGNRSAITVKDGSVARAWGNTIEGGVRDYELYVKKPIFKAPLLEVVEAVAPERLGNMGGSVSVVAADELEAEREGFLSTHGKPAARVGTFGMPNEHRPRREKLPGSAPITAGPPP